MMKIDQAAVILK